MKNGRIRLYVNILLVILVFGSYIGVFFYGAGTLVQNGIGSLRYFTMLSNIFAGVMAAAWLIGLLIRKLQRASR